MSVQGGSAAPNQLHHLEPLSFSGVDSDATWVAKAMKDSKANHFRFLYADVGDTEAFGGAVHKQLAKIPYDYCGKETSHSISFNHSQEGNVDTLTFSDKKYFP